MFFLFIFLLGLCVGSFLNVVIYRYNTGLSINGRSQCFSCGRTLTWFDLIPVMSFLFFRGRCRRCKSNISWQYPLIELTTGLLFVAIYALDGISAFFVFDTIIWSLLIVITVYDIRHKIIPDALVVAFSIVSFIRFFYETPLALVLTRAHILDLLAGFIFFIPFFLLWFFSRGTWMGLGDGKLAIGIGGLLGFKFGLSSIVIGFWIGAIFSILYLFFQWLMQTSLFRTTPLGLYFVRNSLTMKSEIPFAPFLILGLAIVFFLKFDALSIGSLFY